MSIHALVVDDDEFVRGALVRQLGNIGVPGATAAKDWNQARALLQGPLACDVVISDLDMPGAAGSTFLQELAALRPGMRVILISALEPLVLRTAEKEARKLPLQVLGVLAKPASADALRELLRPLEPR